MEGESESLGVRELNILTVGSKSGSNSDDRRSSTRRIFSRVSKDTGRNLLESFFFNSGTGNEPSARTDGTIKVEVIADRVLFTRKELDFLVATEDSERNFVFLSVVAAGSNVGESDVRSVKDEFISLEDFNSAGVFNGIAEVNVGLSSILGQSSSGRGVNVNNARIFRAPSVSSG